MKVLVTGATGYLGSHTAVELVEAGHDVVGVDDFSASSESVGSHISELAGQPIQIVKLDLRNRDAVHAFLATNRFDSIVHFAGRKFVGESVADPMRYYERNAAASAILIRAAHNVGLNNIVFSSSCTVYGNPTSFPVTEASPVAPVSPYGRSKVMVEHMLTDLCAADSNVNALALRYFNPIGGHPSGLLGEIPEGPPNNLLPYVMQVAKGDRPKLSVFGGDYDTPDGTCIRDYIHAVDLARAHVLALDALNRMKGFNALNVGTGNGRSVLEIIAACKTATGVDIPFEIVDRRAGDAAVIYADPTSAEEQLGWKAELDLATMCEDHWRFEQSYSISD